MKGIPQGRYTKEFREEAVKLVKDGAMSLPEEARRLSLPPSTLGKWVKPHKAGQAGRLRQDTEATYGHREMDTGKGEEGARRDEDGA